MISSDYPGPQSGPTGLLLYRTPPLQESSCTGLLLYRTPPLQDSSSTGLLLCRTTERPHRTPPPVGVFCSWRTALKTRPESLNQNPRQVLPLTPPAALQEREHHPGTWGGGGDTTQGPGVEVETPPRHLQHRDIMRTTSLPVSFRSCQLTHLPSSPRLLIG